MSKRLEETPKGWKKKEPMKFDTWEQTANELKQKLQARKPMERWEGRSILHNV